MYKKYRENEAKVNFIRERIEKLNIVDDYKVFVVDLLLRKAYEYDLSDEEIEEDISILRDSLQDICVRVPPPEAIRTVACYIQDFIKIIINEKSLERLPIELYSIFAHELYHALTVDQSRQHKFYWINSITGKPTNALNEIIVECSSARTIRETGISKENPYYSNYTLGYNKTTFAIAMMSAVYGVKERDFLKYALRGEQELKEFLCRKEYTDCGGDINSLSNQSLLKHTKFLERIDANIAMMHNAMYEFETPQKMNKKEQEKIVKEKQNAIVDGFLGISRNCAEMFKERVESCKNDKELNDNLKFSFNQMYFILESVINEYKKSNMIDELTAQMLMGEIEKQKKELFKCVFQKVGQDECRNDTCFNITNDMLRFADIPNDEGKWDNKEKAESFKKVLEKRILMIYPNRGKNVKKYNEDEYVRFQIEYYVERWNISKEEKAILADILMRRAYQFKQTEDDIDDDLSWLISCIDSIDVRLKNEGYDLSERKININARTLLRGDNKYTYKELTFQVYKAIADMSNIKEDDIVYESILERAAHRTVYDKKKSLNPYFNSWDENRIVDLLSIVYGVPENELLELAIKSRGSLIDYLSKKNGEPIEDTELFFDKLGHKLEIVRNLQRVKLGEIGKNKKENDELFIEAFSGIINLCVEKRENLLDRLVRGDISLPENGIYDMCEEMKFSYNGIKKIMKTHNPVIGRKIIERTQKTIGTFRTKIVETEKAIEGQENPRESLKKLYENNYGLTEKNTRSTKYFKLSTEFIKSRSQSQTDELSWGKSYIYYFTKKYLNEKVLKKIKTSFRKKIETLKSGVKQKLLGETQNITKEEMQKGGNGSFDEYVQVGYTPSVFDETPVIEKRDEEIRRNRVEDEEIKS